MESSDSLTVKLSHHSLAGKKFCLNSVLESFWMHFGYAIRLTKLVFGQEPFQAQKNPFEFFETPLFQPQGEKVFFCVGPSRALLLQTAQRLFSSRNRVSPHT